MDVGELTPDLLPQALEYVRDFDLIGRGPEKEAPVTIGERFIPGPWIAPGAE
jgi:hypothetical protein